MDKLGGDMLAMLHWLQKNIPYHFGQVKLLKEAMTHTSAANELEKDAVHNERLEFLGDAVLELSVSEALFTAFPEAREGELTAMRSRLVNQPSLANIARRLGIDQCLLLGKGEESQRGREKDTLLSDAFEALLGAIFLDGGFLAAKEVVYSLLHDAIHQGYGPKKLKDPKSRLQEVTQNLFKDRPVYHQLSSEGPEHQKIFVVRLELPDGRFVETTGTSVKRAEQAAADKALQLLQS